MNYLDVSRFALVALTGAALGCSSNTTSTTSTVAADAQSDTVQSDTAAGDATTGSGDTSSADSTGTGGDAAIADTLADSAGADGASADVGAVDTGAGDTSAAGPVPLDQFTSKIFEVMCAAMVNCGGHTFATVEGCLGFLNSQFDDQDGPADMVALAKAGKASYDAIAAGKCMALYSNCTLITSGKAPGECAAVFTGNTADGGDCDQDEACKSGYCKHNDMLDASCPGVCTAKAKVGSVCQEDDGCEGDALCIADLCAAPGGKLGDACSGNSCGTGLYCVSSDGPQNVCAAKLDVSMPCNDEMACKDGLFCGMNPAGDGAICQTQAKIGAACGGGSGSGSGSGGFGSDAFGTTSGPCEGKAICTSPGAGKPAVCVAKAKVGEACSSNAQCGGMDVQCAGLSDSKAGTCQLLPGKEQPCSQPDFTKGELFTCQLPLMCDPASSKCSDPPGVGQSCMLFCAQGLTCSDGKCTAKATEGQPCGAAQCASGLSCDGIKCVKAVCK